MKAPRKGDTFELIELGTPSEDPYRQGQEFQHTLGEHLKARAYPGVVYSYRCLNARVVEVFVHDTSGVKS